MIELDQAAEAARLRFRKGSGDIRAWQQAADEALRAIEEHAAQTGGSRLELEMAVKRRSRHPELD